MAVLVEIRDEFQEGGMWIERDEWGTRKSRMGKDVITRQARGAFQRPVQGLRLRRWHPAYWCGDSVRPRPPVCQAAGPALHGLRCFSSASAMERGLGPPASTLMHGRPETGAADAA